MRCVVFVPTNFSNPLVFALLKRNTMSCESISAPSSCVSRMPELPTMAHLRKKRVLHTSSLGSVRRSAGVTRAIFAGAAFDASSAAGFRLTAMLSPSLSVLCAMRKLPSNAP